MRKFLKKIFLFGLILGSVFYAYFFVFSYGDKITHPTLTEQAAKLFNKTAIEKITDQEIGWLKRGSTEEDILPRPWNHFYDPIYKTPLTDTAIDLPTKTSISWAHNSLSQTTPIIGTGDYTWESAIYYYQNEDKEKAYIALGHILHLLEDMAVPAHTRDDAHISGDPYETYVENYLKTNKLDIISGLSPNNCSSLDQCFSDLAYYTNTNFFSKDTVFKEKYNLPQIAKSEIKKLREKKFEYNYNNSGQLIALNEYIDSDWYGTINNKNFIVNDTVIHQSYFANLAPKVVAYGAGIIKLFYEEAEKEKNVEPLTWWDSKKIAVANGYDRVKDTAGNAYNNIKETIKNTGTKIVSAFTGQAEKVAVIQGINKTLSKADQILAETNQGNNLIAPVDIPAEAGKATSADEITNLLNDVVKNSAGNFKKSVGKVLGEAAVATKQESKENNLTPTLSLKERENAENLTPTLSSRQNGGQVKEREINLTLPLSSKEREYNAELVKVKYVIDGDTIELEDGRKVRYIGIDTPELNNAGSEDDECLAWEARERNRYLLENAKEIKLIADSGADKDKYGRLLRYVYANTLFVNKILVNEGLAKVFLCEKYMTNCQLMADNVKNNEIKETGNEAKNKKRGIYSEICKEQKNIEKNNLTPTLSFEERENAENLTPTLSSRQNGGQVKEREIGSIENPSNTPPTQSAPFILVTGAPESNNTNEDAGDEETNEETDDENKDENNDGTKKEEEKEDEEKKEIIKEDKLPPISTLKNLAKVNSANFLIEWDGKDYGDIISGIAYYDLMWNILASQGNGEDKIWQWGEWGNLEIATSATSTIFKINDNSLDGKTLCFRVRATDKVGNIEEWPITSLPPSPEGEGENISEQIKCSKINLTHPKTPTISYPTNNFIFDSGINIFSVSGTADIADVGKLAVVEIKPALSNIYKAGEIVIDENGNWKIENIDLAEGENIISARVVEIDGDESESISVSVEKPLKSEYLNVAINEIAWMGTESSTADEWIELYNNTGFNLDLTGWTLNADDGAPQITLVGSIAPYGYYLLERTDDNTVSETADQIYSGAANTALGNDGENLALRDASGNLIDHINCSLAWFAGENGDKKTEPEKKTMERIDPTKSGADSNNWGTNNGVTKNGLDAGDKTGDKKDILGTPRSINSATVSAGIIPHKLTFLSDPIYENVSLTKMGSPYLLDIMIFMEGANLNIEAGTIIKMAANGMLAIYKGTLNIRGTKRWPVILTSEKDDMYGGDTNNDSNATSPDAGDWKALIVNSSSIADISEINNMILKFGALGVSGYVKINNSEISGGSFADEMVLIEGGNIEIQNSFIGGDSTEQKMFNGILVKTADKVDITNTIFENNLGYGVVNNSSNQVKAQNNWWGDASGPHNVVLNPNGLGVEVSDNVDFSNWKISN